MHFLINCLLISIRSLGVSQLVVVINKMDTVNWSKERFDEIVSKLKVFLRQAGFKDTDTTYIPCSGMTGQNLVKPPTESELLSWYTGPTLITVIGKRIMSTISFLFILIKTYCLFNADQFRVPERPVDKSLRMSVTDCFKGMSGLTASGRIETGVLRRNDTISVCPIKEQATVKQITVDESNAISTAFAGDQVMVTLAGIDASSITVGSVICHPKDIVPIATRFQARIIVFNIKMPITNGYPVVLHLQSLVEAAVIVKLKSQLHKGTGEIIKKNPRCLSNNSCAVVEIEVSRPICIEKYANFKELGRVMLRVGGVTIAAGLVTKIMK